MFVSERNITGWHAPHGCTLLVAPGAQASRINKGLARQHMTPLRLTCGYRRVPCEPADQAFRVPSAAVKVFRDLSGPSPGEFAPFLSGVAIVDDVLVQMSWKSSLLPGPVLFFDRPFSVGDILSLGSLHTFSVCL